MKSRVIITSFNVYLVPHTNFYHIQYSLILLLAKILGAGFLQMLGDIVTIAAMSVLPDVFQLHDGPLYLDNI